jgi:hypothetical protein
MSYIQEMLESHPVKPASDAGKARECIIACHACAEACTACADACLAEENVEHLRSCIRKNQDCADVCLATARVVSRLTATDKDLVGAVLRACATVCYLCAAECGSHGGHMEHCAICATACRRCGNACEDLLREPADAEPLPG